MTLIDTSVWSLALRRDPDTLNDQEHAIVQAWARLANSRRAAIVGIVRQEILSGIANEALFTRLRDRLNTMPHLRTDVETHDLAASFYNRCRRRGITTSAADILVCASARLHRVPVFTVDTDFERIAPLVEIELWRAPPAQ